MAQNEGPQVAQSRPNWDITEQEAGMAGSQAENAEAAPTRKALAALEFGAFVVNGSGGYDKFSNAATSVVGPALFNNLARNNTNRLYTIGELASVGRRGYFLVKIDTANKPVAYGAVKISYAAGKEGYLTSAGSSFRTAASGIQITEVLDSVAEVYLDGSPVYAVA
jgi:hypothetical protein